MHPYKVVPYECMYKNTALEGGMNNKAMFVLHTSLCLQETELFSINQRCPCLIKFCYKLVMALNCVNNPQSLAPFQLNEGAEMHFFPNLVLENFQHFEISKFFPTLKFFEFSKRFPPY